VIAKYNRAICSLLTLKDVLIAEYGFKNLLVVNTYFANVRHHFAISAVISSIEIHAERVIYGKYSTG
jgi:hypothetical protein